MNFAEYKTNTQKSVLFLYTTHEKYEKKIKKTTPLKITSKRIKYLGIHLTKDMRLVHWKL